jgi:hypothetical protein
MTFDSISNVPPADQGGRDARTGFEYQDLCALRYCIHAASGRAWWQEVWCESHDDLVLYVAQDGQERYRYVQVKYRTGAGFYWTVARLCAPETSGRDVLDSLLAKLLARDEFAGECDFRLATNVDCGADLRDLSYQWGRNECTGTSTCAGVVALVDKLSVWERANQKSIGDHILRFAIERHTTHPDDLTTVVRHELERFLEERDQRLFPDELDRVFTSLYRLVYKAASADLNLPDRPECIPATKFVNTALSEARQAQQALAALADDPPSEALKTHLATAGVGDAIIRAAVQARNAYVSMQRRSRGTELGSRLGSVLNDVSAIAAEVSLAFSLQPNPDGRAVLQAVLEQSGRLFADQNLAAQGIPIHVIHGMCYFLITRGGLVLPAGANDAGN